MSSATLRIIRQNLGWAFGYDLILLPLAVADVLPPVFAALALAFSSVPLRPGGAGRSPGRSLNEIRRPGL